MDDWLRNLIEQLQGSFSQGSIQPFLGRDLPSAPDIGPQIESLEGISGQLAGLFGPQQRAGIVQGFREAGAGAVGQAGAGARRAIGAQAGSTGISESSPFTSQISNTFSREAEAMTGVESEAANLGMNLEQNFMQALLGQAGLQGQIANLKGLDFQNLFGLQQARGQELPNFLDLYGQLSAIGQVGGF